MNTICPKHKCTGCFACASACPRDAISMTENQYGELHPLINESKCTSCGICRKVCPVKAPPSYLYPLKCYASWLKDKDKRRICASGGVGTMLSEYFIREKKGIVFGSRYDSSWTPIMTFTEKLEELERFKGSRYVQSIVGEQTFKQVRAFLNDDRYVLFIGTPCQIAGLLGFLHKEYSKLLTVDLICHGCCPTKYFKEEIGYLVKKHKLADISDIRFRGNDKNNYCLSIWSTNNGQTKRIYKKTAYEQPYFAGFLLSVSLRENCYACDYARPERVSDITIGDFIGLGNSIKFPYPRHNVSSVTINTKKGAQFYENVKMFAPELINVERDYSERLEYRPSLIEPSKRHEVYGSFREEYMKSGYILAIRKSLKLIIRCNKIKRVLNSWTYIYRIPIKIWKILTKTVIS